MQRRVCPGDGASVAAVSTLSGAAKGGNWDANTSDRHGNKRPDNPLPSLWRVPRALSVASSWWRPGQGDGGHLQLVQCWSWRLVRQCLIPKRPHQAPPPTRPIVSASALA
ncbi:uncharacterized protein SPSK_02059 [Sporothrix schenckii 1099-18]|uniref:Uncharacterized protein n=1 Tax=Sporothrix schenckii 1099-18 TaxID=1397361 RepID=A0A0F2MD02_SPOSC|nr:uncharacterized protein SPSK_02059 [Sporothrix schenckii 1099-18]KJR87568.1 hypothetical protein SPSK_02059 [Sporothrix schenckii 1099-18]